MWKALLQMFRSSSSVSRLLNMAMMSACTCIRMSPLCNKKMWKALLQMFRSSSSVSRLLNMAMMSACTCIRMYPLCNKKMWKALLQIFRSRSSVSRLLNLADMSACMCIRMQQPPNVCAVIPLSTPFTNQVLLSHSFRMHVPHGVIHRHYILVIIYWFL